VKHLPRCVPVVTSCALLIGCGAAEVGNDLAPPAWTHRTIAVGRGDSMHVVHRRLDASRTLVFVPGLADTWESYLSLVVELPDTFGYVLVDPLGHGASTKRKGANGPRRQAEALAAALDTLGVHPFAMFGHSYGGVITQVYGSAHPDLAAAVLIATATGFGSHAGADGFRDLAASMPDTVPDEVLELQRESFLGPVADSIVSPYIDAARASPGHVWREVIDSLLVFDTSSILGGWRPRTLLVMAENDKVIGNAPMDSFAAAMPGADTIRIPRTSHGVHWERPDTVAAVVVSFLGAVR
jgi:3-oxoadipate enol-lactonase